MLQLSNPDILLNVPDTCICWLGPMAAEGKTYLRKLLEAHEQINPSSILTLTYIKDINSDFYVDKVLNFKGKVLMCDRTDLYMSDALQSAIVNFKGIALIDIKNFQFWNVVPGTFCTTKMSPGRVEVTTLC